MAELTETAAKPTRAYVIHPDLGRARTQRREPEHALAEAVSLVAAGRARAVCTAGVWASKVVAYAQGLEQIRAAQALSVELAREITNAKYGALAEESASAR